jgi:hypothetical protein
MKIIRYKKDCNKTCQTCRPVDYETYDNYSNKEKNNEAEKSGCRGRQSIDRYMKNGDT